MPIWRYIPLSKRYLQEKEINIDIRNATAADRSKIFQVHRKAFGNQQGPEVETLVNNLLNDRTAEPGYSFVTVEGDMIIGTEKGEVQCSDVLNRPEHWRE